MQMFIKHIFIRKTAHRFTIVIGTCDKGDLSYVIIRDLRRPLPAQVAQNDARFIRQ